MNLVKAWWHGLVCWNRVTAVWELTHCHAQYHILIKYECDKCGWSLKNE
jgi:hypothetical protein